MSEYIVPKLGDPAPPTQAPPAAAKPVAGGSVFFPPGTKAPVATGGLYWSPAEYEGALHLFLGNEGPVNVETNWGTKSAATSRAIVVFADDGEPAVYTDQQVIQSVLAKQLATRKYFPARLTKGTPGKGGRAAPWLLTDATEEDLAFLNRWLAAHAVQKGEDIYLKFELETPAVEDPGGDADF